MPHLRDWIWERLRLWRTFKGLQPSKPHWLYPFWTAAVLPEPPLTLPPRLLPQHSPFYVQFHIYQMYSDNPSLNFRLWTNSHLLRQGVFFLFAFGPIIWWNGLEQSGQWNIRPAQSNLSFWKKSAGALMSVGLQIVVPGSCPKIQSDFKFPIWPPFNGIFF